MMYKNLYASTAIAVIISALSASAIAEGDTDKVVQTGKDTALSKIDQLAGEYANDLVGGRLKHLEVSITEDDWKMGGEALAVIGLSETDDSFTFTQLSTSRRHERTTMNAGIGYRQMTGDDTGIVGVNAFGDSEVNTGHQRVGFGLEYLSLSGSLHFNHYARTSGEKTVKGVIEKAMSGEDLAYRYRFDDKPFKPSVSVRGFRWRGDNGYETSGSEFGVGLSITENVRFDMFHKDESKSKAETRGQLSYVVTLGAEKAVEVQEAVGVSKQRARLKQMMYQPVMRQNHIKKTTVNLGIVFTTG
ncbi:MAG: inverse autotransporter beta domain-containing protein [Candidatus Puniceispirillaceae bacterium]